VDLPLLLRRYEEVAKIGQEINHELSTPGVLFQKLHKRVGSVLDTSDAFLLAIYQPQTNTLDMYMDDRGQYLIRENDVLSGACKHVIETKETLLVRQMSEEAKHLPFQRVQITTKSGPKESMIFVPLVFRDVPLGVLSVQHKEPHIYNQEDLSILQLLANHIALALHNIRLYDNLSRLNEVGQLLTQQLASEDVLQATAEKIQEATKADVVVLCPYESTTQHFINPPRIAGTLYASPIESMSPSQPNGVALLTLRQTEPIFARESSAMYTSLRNIPDLQPGNFQEREGIRSAAAMPLSVGEISVGVLFINFRQPQRFDASQKLLIEGLAHYAAIAINNAQQYAALVRRRVHELEILQNVDRELARNLDLNSVLNTLLTLANEHVPADACAITLPDPQKQVIEVRAALGRGAEVRRSTVIPFQETRSITHWVLEHKQPALVKNVHEPPWRDLYFSVDTDIISELDVPLLDGEEVVGIFNFESTKEDSFRQEDQDFLLTLAGQAVLAIKNAQAYEREKRLVVEAQIFNQISLEITRRLDRDSVFNLILEKALELTGSTTGTLELYNAEWNDLEMLAERGVTEERKHQRLDLDQGVVGYVAKNRQLLNVDPSQPPWSELYVPSIPGTRSELAVPMLEGDELRGVLNVESPIPNKYKERDIHLLEGLGQLAVVALQNAERYDKAESLAQRFEWLYQAGQELGEITEFSQIDQAYDIILSILQKYCDGHVVLSRYEDDTRELAVIRASHQPGHLLTLHEKNNQQGKRRPILIYDLKRPPEDVALAELTDLDVRSLVATPIEFKERYYGYLEISHKEVGHYVKNDVHFVQGLTQQLASTIYRIETIKARQEFERISSIGHSTFELTHRLANDLALVPFYTSDIQWEMQKLGTVDEFIDEKLNDIVQSIRGVLNFSDKLKRALISPVEEEPVLMSPQDIFKEAMVVPSLPPTIQISQHIDTDVGVVRAIRGQIVDIIRNLVINAMEVIPTEGEISLRAHNSGDFVALEVTDTGPGILPQHLAQIFDLSFSTKGGSGFGLWSARRNALRNRGDLRVESVPGCTTFILLLPRADGERV
jgi:GAF domain-containing protein